MPSSSLMPASSSSKRAALQASWRMTRFQTTGSPPARSRSNLGIVDLPAAPRAGRPSSSTTRERCRHRCAPTPASGPRRSRKTCATHRYRPPAWIVISPIRWLCSRDRQLAERRVGTAPARDSSNSRAVRQARGSSAAQDCDARPAVICAMRARASRRSPDGPVGYSTTARAAALHAPREIRQPRRLLGVRAARGASVSSAIRDTSAGRFVAGFRIRPLRTTA